MVYTLRFLLSLQNAVCFIILTYLVPILFTFYIQGVLKLKKNNSGAKRLMGVICFTMKCAASKMSNRAYIQGPANSRPQRSYLDGVVG